MIPILYDKYETDFLSNGLGQLGDCLSCTVTEQINGIYEVEFTYPMNGAYYEQLINFGGVVACTHDHNGDVQLFDIYKYTAPIDGIVTFYGHHVAYRLSNILWTRDIPGVAWMRSPAEIFSYWNNGVGLVSYSPIKRFTFTDYSDYTPFSDHSVIVPFSTLWEATRGQLYQAALSNKDNGSILEIWPGEWEFNKFDINFYKKRGQDRGVQIRFGKNMIGVDRERDWGGTVSVIYATWNNGSIWAWYDQPAISPKVEYSISQWETPNNGKEQMYSGAEMLFFKPAQLNIAVLDLSSELEGYPGESGTDVLPHEDEVRAYCLDYMSKNSTWRANDNISVEFLDLYGTPEYENIQGLTDCRLGDFVSILYPQLGIVSNGVEIMSLTYDVLQERVIEMQLNTIRTTLAQVIIDSIGGK